MKHETTLTFGEQYDELQALGIPDWQIAKRLNLTVLSLQRMLIRAGKPISPLLKEMAASER